MARNIASFGIGRKLCRLSTILLLLTMLFGYLSEPLNAQTPGLIYKPAEGEGRSILNPSGSGFSSQTTAGFTFSDTDESEIPFVPLYQREPEPTHDVRTGSGGGHTDMVGQIGDGMNTAFMYYDRENEALLFRIRLAGQSTASKGYSFLFNTDFEQFGPQAANFTASNPGFQYEVVLETGKGVAIYQLTGDDATLLERLEPLDNFFQKSISYIHYGLNGTNTSETGFFYDFYVPVNQLPGDFFGDFRVTVATITRAQSGITGTISDLMGAEAIDPGVQCSGGINALDGSGGGCTEVIEQTNRPSIDIPIFTTADEISGRLSEDEDATVWLEINGVSQGSVEVAADAFTWSFDVSAVSLEVGDVVRARALAGNKEMSDWREANVIAEGVVPCTERPTNIQTGSTGGGNWLSGQVDGLPEGWSTDDLIVRGYHHDGSLFFSTEPGESESFQPVFTDAVGEEDFRIDRSGTPQPGGSPFNSNNNDNYLVTVQYLDECESDFSDVVHSDQPQTDPPTITSTDLTAASTEVSVEAPTATADLILYKITTNADTEQIGFVEGSGHSGTHTFTGLTLDDGERVFARARDSGETLSMRSNVVNVGDEISEQQADPPQILSTNTAEPGQTIEGFTNEGAARSSVSL